MPWERHFEDLRDIAKAFYQAYRLTGTIKMKFSVRFVEDSDGDSVVDVYVSPLDAEAASTLASGNPTHHMQLLETMVPAALLGYQFIMQIIPQGPNDIHLSVVEPSQPFLTAGRE